VCCEKQAAACSVTASVVNYLYFAVIGDRHVGIYASQVNWRTVIEIALFIGLGVADFITETKITTLFSQCLHLASDNIYVGVLLFSVLYLI